MLGLCNPFCRHQPPIQHGVDGDVISRSSLDTSSQLSAAYESSEFKQHFDDSHCNVGII